MVRARYIYCSNATMAMLFVGGWYMLFLETLTIYLFSYWGWRMCWKNTAALSQTDGVRCWPPERNTQISGILPNLLDNALIHWNNHASPKDLHNKPESDYWPQLDYNLHVNGLTVTLFYRRDTSSSLFFIFYYLLIVIIVHVHYNFWQQTQNKK